MIIRPYGLSPQEGHASGAQKGEDALQWTNPFSEEIAGFVDPLGLFEVREGMGGAVQSR